MEVCFHKKIDPTECDLIIAVPSVGNAGQMAGDVLLSTLPFKNVGAILADHLVPMCGYDDFSSGIELCGPLDLYHKDNLLLCIQRSYPRQGLQNAFYHEFAEVIKEKLPCKHKIIITGASLESVGDPSSQKFFFVPPLRNEESIELRKEGVAFKPLLDEVDQFYNIPGYLFFDLNGEENQPSISDADGKVNESIIASLRKNNPLLDTVFDFGSISHREIAEKPVGMGCAGLLYRYINAIATDDATRHGESVSILGMFLYEGDNRPDGVEFAKVLIRTIFHKEAADGSLKTPKSWESLGGAATRESTSFPAVI